MPNKVKNLKTGVQVKINSKNSKKIAKIIEKTHRTFASEVNLGVERHCDNELPEWIPIKLPKQQTKEK